MATPHPLRVVLLGSGSAGNAAAITDGSTTILVDCGFSARDVSRRLASAGIRADGVSAVFVTHEHTDHVKGVDVFARRHAIGCRVFATAGTRDAAAFDRSALDIETVRGGEPVCIGTLEVVPFRTSHDAAEPVGYRVSNERSRVGIATDTGVMTPEAMEALHGVDTLCIESNHDIGMLERGPYPAFLKRRILSSSGHLSNTDSAAALARLASARLTHVFALHRSRTNNTAALAASELRSVASRMGLTAEITVAAQDLSCDSHPPQGSLFSGGAQ